MNPWKPWKPIASIPAGEKLGPIYVSEDCPGCGHPSVLGEVKTFPIIGLPEYAPSWPTPRLYKQEHTSMSFVDHAEWSGGGGASGYYRETRSMQGNNAFTIQFEPEEEKCITTKARYHECSGPDSTCSCAYGSVYDRTTRSVTEPDYDEERKEHTCLPYYSGMGVVEALSEDSLTITKSRVICRTTKSAQWNRNQRDEGPGDYVYTHIGNSYGMDYLSDEDTFADAAARAAQANSSLGVFCWNPNPYLYPLAHPGIGSPWNCQPCSHGCEDQPGFIGHGNFYSSGVHWGQGTMTDEGGLGYGCLRLHWGLVGKDEGTLPAAAAAKYRIVIPYDAALPDTQLDVSWDIVRRANKGAILAKSQTAEGVTATEIWRKTVQVGAPAEGGGFTEGGGAMDAPEDSLGSLHGNDESWDDVGFQVVEETLQVFGRKQAESAASRAMYKFVIHEYDGSGTASWDIEYLNAAENVIQTDPQTAPIIDGETEIQFLAADPVEDAVSVRVVGISVTTDEGSISRGTGISGQWMLQAKIRTGKWGFAELTGNGTNLYPMRITTFEHEINGGGGSCENACEDCETDCPSGSSASIHETEETVEALVDGEFQTVRTIDESVDNSGEEPRILRWGREVYGSDGNSPPQSLASGRPHWFWPLGCIPDDPQNPLYVPDPYVADNEETPTKIVIEDTLTHEDTRVCAALVATEPDPKGQILGVTKRTATTHNAEDSTSIMRLPATTALNDCIDYGSPTLGDGLVSSVPDEAARLALKAWDGKESWDSDCPNGVPIGAKILQGSNNTFWEVISHPPEPCGTLTEEHWKQLRYKTTPEQFMHTEKGGCTYFLENIVAKKCP